ncbi:MAG: carboxypeptidase-like regulatory domain-containing protein [Bacteroidota bacterium]
MLSAKVLKIWALSCFLLVCSFFSAQDYLAKTVSLNVTNQPYEAVFKQISRQTGVVFSYSAFNSQQKTTYSCTKKTLDKVLDELLENKCSYKARDKYIILTCADKTPAVKEKMTVRGTVFDLSANKKLRDASVFVKANKHSVLTDHEGNFVLIVPKTNGIVVTVAKIGYADTSVWVENGQSDLHIGMKPLLKVQQPREIAAVYKDTALRRQDSIYQVSEKNKLDSLLDSWEDEGRRIWNKLRAKNPNFRNITDTLFSQASFSFVPPFSTNRLLSLNTVNRFSFNVLVGHSKGVEGFELGGLVNIDAGDVRYAQIAGLANIVRGDVEGFQLGGITNLNGGSLQGAQIAGIFNQNLSFCDGFQLAGIANLNHAACYGAQISGITNINRGFFDGFQLAGIANISNRNAYGFQLAGISNQVFGVMGGTQLAGIYNSADTMYGFQLAGIVNRAREMYGVQLGLINLANNHYGIPIGLFSFVRNGHHKLEFAYDDLDFGTVAFRTGVDRFHNIVFGGLNRRDKESWTIGYGLGSSFKCSSKWYFNMDLTAQTVQQKKGYWNGIRALGKFYAGMEFRALKKLSFFAGATLNAYVSDEDTAWQPVSYVSKNFLYEKSFSQTDLKTWVGLKFGVRFF